MNSQTHWKSLPRRVRMNPYEIHVWRCPLSLSDNRASALLPLLSSDELIRAGGFVFKSDRARFIVARAFLRLLLGRYLQRPVHSVRFRYGASGKPDLVAGPLDQPVGFDLAQEGEWAICAVAPSSQLRVDIKRARSDVGEVSLAGSFLSNEEGENLQSEPVDDRTPTSLTYLTKKDSYGESTGLRPDILEGGFLSPPATSQRAEIVKVERADERLREWFMEEFSPARGYIGSVVARGLVWNVAYLNFVFELRPVHEMQLVKT